jgi:hypothetical protein
LVKRSAIATATVTVLRRYFGSNSTDGQFSSDKCRFPQSAECVASAGPEASALETVRHDIAGLLNRPLTALSGHKAGMFALAQLLETSI